VLINRKLTKKLARKIIQKFYEVVVAPDFEKESLKILKNKKNLIILKINKSMLNKLELRSTIFGDLYQDLDSSIINEKFLELKSNHKNNKSIEKDLIFSLKVAKHLKSNSIALCKNQQTIGLGIGQTSRISALKIAIKNIKQNKSFVCASDGFFPFIDSLKLLKKFNCKAIAQPFGSINDKKIIEYANKNKISLYFIKNRLFKH